MAVVLHPVQSGPHPRGGAGHAVVTRAGGFHTPSRRSIGVPRPDQLETHEAWGQFMAEYRLLDERVQVLVEKIVLENRRRPFTAHFFTRDEVASPTPGRGQRRQRTGFLPLDLRAPHAAGRSGRKTHHRRPGRRRTPADSRQFGRAHPQPARRGLDGGRPAGCFKTGGLPNTAMARIPLPPNLPPRKQFHQLVDEIWMKADTVGQALNELAVFAYHS